MTGALHNKASDLRARIGAVVLKDHEVTTTQLRGRFSCDARTVVEAVRAVGFDVTGTGAIVRSSVQVAQRRNPNNERVAKAERRAAIREAKARDPDVTMAALAQRFGVNASSIRRALEEGK